ncbi:MAG: MATE family efflux transporter [Oscillospiraceae bacterium]|nr:MATE family efflux transporter [Oscillospiraceae bacterium]
MDNPQAKLGTMPIAPLLIKMSVPMMISMFVQALYNTVDSMFVASISEDALAAVSLAWPIQVIMNAIAIGTGVGTAAFVSRCLGMGDHEKAEKAANVQIFLSAVYTLVFILVGIFGVKAYFRAQTEVASIVEYGSSYLSIVCICCIGSVFCQNFEKLLIATGNSAQSMISQASGAVFNILFDWLLIFGIGPFPALGIRGAAIATVLGQILTASLGFTFLRKRGGLKFRFSKMLPNREVLKNIYAVGIPCSLTIGLDSVMGFIVNQILLTFSTTATAVFGVWLKLQSFSFMPVFGMNNGTIAIYAYNYGAGNLERVKKTLRLALICGVITTSLFALCYEIFPKNLITLFDAGENMMEIGTVALRLCAVSLPFAAVTIILSSPFEALGSPQFSLFNNLFRQIIFLCPLAWLFSLSGVLDRVWLAPMIAEFTAMVIALLFLRKVLRRLTRELT